ISANDPEIGEKIAESMEKVGKDGVYFVQCANTGISGVFAPNGKELDATRKNEACTLTTSVYFMQEQTFYSKYGDIFSYICLLIFLIWIILKLPIYTINNKNN
ncbi:unnamed protein product, partial [marine sediment metagenome]